MDFIKANDFFSIIEFDPVIMYPAVTKDVAYEIVALFCAFHRVSLRRMEQLCARLDAALVNLPSNTAFSFIELVGSVFSYELYPKFKLNYSTMYRSGKHNWSGCELEISYIGDPNGDNAQKALEHYTSVWNSMVYVREHAYQPSHLYQIEQGFRNNLNSLISRFDNFVKCEHLENFICLHRSNKAGFEISTEKLIRKMKDNSSVKILTGSEFEQYLHLFNDFS
ncbi:hypothetical protein K0H59_01620 [Shewanella sp. FJAT-51649]|uniref:hypothetical protein n=1 Tax=Shewanella sp. FJAT-51649 TaxID=2864210 RepID=UPI001C65ACFF|nr:hypothetical protein [Shewanella sp. FJAT-51649]QYJ71775.1 hypothetical protein K0H59_01620 [Shewanella sp. FJAT-51649]